MKRSQEILNQLDLDYKVLVRDSSYMISPMDFLCDIKIILIDNTDSFTMFIWKDNEIQKECVFKEVGNITDIYSYLYNYDKNNLKTRTNDKSRKNQTVHREE